MSLKLNLGCGEDVREGWVNIDHQTPDALPVPYHHPWEGYERPSRIPSNGCFIRADLDKRIPLVRDAATFILAQHVLEHLRDPIDFLDDCHRVLAPGGQLSVVVPHADHPNATRDPTHRTFWRQGSMDHVLVPEDRRDPDAHEYTDRLWRKTGFELVREAPGTLTGRLLNPFGQVPPVEISWTLQPHPQP